MAVVISLSMLTALLVPASRGSVLPMTGGYVDDDVDQEVPLG